MNRFTFSRQKISIQKIGVFKFWSGLFLGISASVILSLFFNIGRESLRIITVFSINLLITSDSVFQFYNYFFVSLATTLGLCLTIVIWFSGNRAPSIHKRLMQRLCLTYTLLIFGTTLIFVVRLASAYNISPIAFPDNAAHTLFIEEAGFFMFLIPLNVFLISWSLTRLVYKTGKWILYSIPTCILIILVLANTTTVDRSIVNDKFNYRIEKRDVRLIQGDWKEVYENLNPNLFYGYAHFSGDSVFFENYAYEKYSLKNDTLIIQLDNPYRSVTEEYITEKKFKVLHLSNDSLALEQRRVYSNGSTIITDTIRHQFIRFKPLVNQPQLTRIEFASGGCFGKCPQKDIVIDSSGFYYYGPRKFDVIKQPYMSNSEKELFNHISSLTSSIPISRFDSLNGVNIDSQVLIADFHFERGTIKQVRSDNSTPLFPVFVHLDFSYGFAKSLQPADTLKIAARDSIEKQGY